MAQPWELDWSATQAGDGSSLPWERQWGAPVAKQSETGDTWRGLKESFQQLPQLGYGILAGFGAAAENVVGEGGIATGIKKAGVKGYTEWGDKIAAEAKESDSWSYSYDQAKQGNFGALVDWLQHGIGYTAGQGAQMLLTAGIGAVGGKFVASTAAKQIAEGMVAKEAAKLAVENAALEVGKRATADKLGKLAVANVAAKFASAGQMAAVGALATGQEGGEIFGDLTKNNQDRPLTGAEIGKAFGATLAAGGLEFIGDKLGLDIVLGKSKLLKPTEYMPGIKGRVARGIVAGAAVAPAEGLTEYAQTGVEEYGKGNEASPLPWQQSEQSKAQAFDAAMLGALGGTVIGGAGGAIHGAKKRPDDSIAKGIVGIASAQTLDEAIDAAAQAVGTTSGEPTHSDRVAAIRAELTRPVMDELRAKYGDDGATQFLNSLNQAANSQATLDVRERHLQAVEQTLTTMRSGTEGVMVGEGRFVEPDRLAPLALPAPQQLPELPGGRTQERDLGTLTAEADLARRKQAELDAIPDIAAEQDETSAILERVGRVEGPSALALALERLRAPKAEPAAQVPAAEPRIVKRSPEMQPTSLAKAQSDADANGGEVVRVKNQSGKFAYVALPQNVTVPTQTTSERLNEMRAAPTVGASEAFAPEAGQPAIAVEAEPASVGTGAAEQPAALSGATIARQKAAETRAAAEQALADPDAVGWQQARARAELDRAAKLDELADQIEAPASALVPVAQEVAVPPGGAISEQEFQEALRTARSYKSRPAAEDAAAAAGPEYVVHGEVGNWQIKKSDAQQSPAQATQLAPDVEPAARPAAGEPSPRPPASFRNRHQVKTQVFSEESGSFEEQSVSADAAMKALDADIAELQAFKRCIGA